MTEQTYTVLAVDDEPAVLRLLGAMLRDSAYRLVTATSGDDALAVALSEPVDVVLLDIMMPDVSGIAVARQMSAHPRLKDVPVVMITAASGLNLLQTAHDVSRGDVLLKPLSKNVLFYKLEEVLA